MEVETILQNVKDNGILRAPMLSPGEKEKVEEFKKRCCISPKAADRDQTAIRFLAARKFKPSEAVELYNSYLNFLKVEGIGSIDPLEEQTRRELLSGKFTILNDADPTGARVAQFFVRLHRPAHTSHWAFLQSVMFQLEASLRKETAVRNGIILIYDMTSSKYANFDADLSKKLFKMLKSSYPVRLRRIIVLTAPLWFRAPFHILRAFIKEELRDRVNVIYPSPGSRLASLSNPDPVLAQRSHQAWLTTALVETGWLSNDSEESSKTLQPRLPTISSFFDKSRTCRSERSASFSDVSEVGDEDDQFSPLPGAVDAIEDSLFPGDSNLDPFALSSSQSSEAEMEPMNGVAFYHAIPLADSSNYVSSCCADYSSSSMAMATMCSNSISECLPTSVSVGELNANKRLLKNSMQLTGLAPTSTGASHDTPSSTYNDLVTTPTSNVVPKYVSLASISMTVPNKSCPNFITDSSADCPPKDNLFVSTDVVTPTSENVSAYPGKQLSASSCISGLTNSASPYSSSAVSFFSSSSVSSSNGAPSAGNHHSVLCSPAEVESLERTKTISRNSSNINGSNRLWTRKSQTKSSAFLKLGGGGSITGRKTWPSSDCSVAPSEWKAVSSTSPSPLSSVIRRPLKQNPSMHAARVDDQPFRKEKRSKQQSVSQDIVPFWAMNRPVGASIHSGPEDREGRTAEESAISLPERVTSSQLLTSSLHTDSNSVSSVDESNADVAEDTDFTSLWMDAKQLVSHVEMKGIAGLGEEYATVCRIKSTDPCTAFRRACNASKNRYIDVSCLETSRVLLKIPPASSPILSSTLPSTDKSSPVYIHANWVDSYRQKNAFICTQGPLAETAGDFWCMLWNYNVPAIVMITRCYESQRCKCYQYWPSTKGQSLRFSALSPGVSVLGGTTKKSHSFLARRSSSEVTGSSKLVYEITNLNIDVSEHYTRTKLLLKDVKSGQSRTVEHFSFHSWPDHGVPSDTTALLELLSTVETAYANLISARLNYATIYDLPIPPPPIVVHCSAGIGRTGTFIALDVCTKQLLELGCVNIPLTVSRIRSQRYGSVQVSAQYIFIYRAILDFAVSHGLLKNADVETSRMRLCTPSPQPLLASVWGANDSNLASVVSSNSSQFENLMRFLQSQPISNSSNLRSLGTTDSDYENDENLEDYDVIAELAVEEEVDLVDDHSPSSHAAHNVLPVSDSCSPSVNAMSATDLSAELPANRTESSVSSNERLLPTNLQTLIPYSNSHPVHNQTPKEEDLEYTAF